MAASDPDRVQAGYGQLMFWLSQMRAGVAKPEFVERTPGEGWPQPLLLYMRGQYTEAELTVPVAKATTRQSAAEHQHRRAAVRGAVLRRRSVLGARAVDVARDYFAALVNMKIIYFLEHGLALAEIAKLRERTALMGTFLISL